MPYPLVPWVIFFELVVFRMISFVSHYLVHENAKYTINYFVNSFMVLLAWSGPCSSHVVAAFLERRNTI